MSRTIGDYIWIPCEVKPGPFANERLVLMQSTVDEWMGFVQQFSLKETTTEGENAVKAQVVDVNCELLTAKIFGEPLTGGSYYREQIERTTPIDTLQA